VRFWDSSAIVPLIVEERTSKACRGALRADPSMLVWCFTRTEVLSAVHREHRAGRLDTGAVRVAESRLDKLSARWSEVDAVSETRDVAERLLRTHPLRCADALQLAAALVAYDSRPKGHVFVVRDQLLTEAAEREGFDVLEPAGR
jgi:predicted nucleic acid-binding protein